jgi:vacuolar protein sorting-associated protein 33A
MIYLGYVQLPASLVSPPSNPNPNASSSSTSAVQTTPLSKEAKKKYQLNAKSDPLLSELRDLNFSAVGKRLNKIARRLEEDYQVMSPSVLVLLIALVTGTCRQGSKLRL